MTSEGAEPVADERRLHVAFVLVRIARIVRSAFPTAIGVGIGLRALGVPGGTTTIALVVALGALAAIVAVLVEWHRTRYAVVDGSLRLRQGLFRRSERIVPRSRISTFDTSRGVLQRLFGLVSLKVQSAGGGRAAEIELPTISFSEVSRLQTLLGDHRGAVADPARVHDADIVAAPPLYAIGTRELLVAALSGPQIGVVAVVIGSVASQAEDVVPRGVRRQAEQLLTSSSLTTLLLVAFGLLALAGIVAFVGTVLAYARFTVERDGTRLRIRRGALTERIATVEQHRIHGVRVVEGMLRRRLGYASVQVEVVGYRGEDEFARTLVPLVRREQIAELLGQLVPDLTWTDGVLERPPVRARRRYWTGPLLLGLVPTVAAVVVLDGPWQWLAVLGPLLGLALGERRWRGAGWRQDAGTLTVRWQLLARTTLLLRRDRIQIARTRVTPFQRRAGLATFSAALATRRGTVGHLDEDVAVALRESVARRVPLYSDAPAGVAQSVRAAES